jgi:hypothetical protein
MELAMTLATLVIAAPAPAQQVDITSAVGLLNYGVLGILTLGFIRGWVVSPKERDRLVTELDSAKADLKTKDTEIARLNEVIQENLQAMTATMDKQIELATARMRREESSPHGGS